MGLGAGIGLDKPGVGASVPFILALFTVNDVAFVDVVHGDDATAQVGNQALPFATLSAAQTAATSGQLVFMWPGTESTSGNLGKDGITYYFCPGAAMTPPAGSLCFSLATAIDISVFGYGTFTTIDFPVLRTTSASSTVVFEAKSALRLSGGATVSIGAGSTAYVTFKEGISSLSNTIYNDSSILYLTAPFISSTRALAASLGSSARTYLNFQFADINQSGADLNTLFWCYNGGKMFINGLNATVNIPNSTVAAVDINGTGGGYIYYNGNITVTAINSTYGTIQITDSTGVFDFHGKIFGTQILKTSNVTQIINSYSYNRYSMNSAKISGRYYHGGDVSAPQSYGVGTHSTGFIRAQHIYVPNTFRIDRLGSYLNAGAVGANIRVAIYYDNGTNYPGALYVDSGNIAATAGGLAEATVDVALYDHFKWYWIAIQNSDAAISFYQYTVAAMCNFYGLDNTATSATYLRVAQAYGAFPSTFPAGGIYRNEVCPFNLYRVV